MIIRSQDKKILTKFESVSISNEYKVNVKREREIVGYKVFASYGDTTDFVVGTYSTEEKAIKVLDMIQSAYNAIETMKIDKGAWRDNHYFEMPQDSEV